MILVGLRKRLADPSLTEEEKKRIQAQVKQLESEMDM